MTDKLGRTASVLRMVILLLLAGMCYQLGYNAGFCKGNWQTRQRQVWDAVEASTTVDLDQPEQPVTDLAEIDNGEAVSAGHGIMLAPPVVLRGACRPDEPVGQARVFASVLAPI